MGIQKKQATWNQERPLFEENFIHSHLLEYFNFNESTGDYELVEVTPNFVARDVVFEIVNTGWAMWLRAKCNAKSQAVPECVWVESYDGSVFESSCGHTFELSNDGTLDDNNMKHCCFCGGKIEAQEQSHE